MRRKFSVFSVAEKYFPGGVFLVAALMFSYFSILYIQRWYIGYSSDTALIGLMAKHISELKEFPVFVWSVGYQGIILEAYLLIACAGFARKLANPLRRWV